MDNDECINGSYVVSELLAPTNLFPNNSKLPLLVYKGAFALRPDDTPEVIKARFAENGYHTLWEGDVYEFDHFHANTHEVLAVFSGHADIVFGGQHCIEVNRGDVMIIPAGVAHRKTKSSDNFLCIGAYPENQKPDIQLKYDTGKPVRTSEVPVPEKDPVYGADVTHFEKYWR